MAKETVAHTQNQHYKPISFIRNKHFYIITALIVIFSLTYYADYLNLSWLPFFERFFTREYLHDLHRALFLIPMLYTAVVFRLRGALIISLVVFVIVLPRAIFISPYPDAELRAVIFSIVAVLATILLGLSEIRRLNERKIRRELAAAHHDLQNSAELIKASEARYRNLFNSASDAILIRDLKGNIIEANQEAAKLTGYTLEDLTKLNISQIFSADSFELSMKKQQDLLKGKDNAQRYEMELIKKDGTRAIIDSVPSLITENGQPVGFQSMMRDITEQKKILENMQFYIGEITTAQEDERKRISRELHDETAQALATLLLDVEVLDRARDKISNEETQTLEQLRARINTIMEGIRRFAHELRPPVLDQIGLVPALESLIQELNEDGKIKGTIEITGLEHRLSNDTELAIFRIAQEALHNVRKHSQANEVLIKVEFIPDMLRLSVTDNGRGFELPKVIGNFAGTGKLGLIGMQERARLLGGSLSVKSQVGKGTTVSVEIGNKSD